MEFDALFMILFHCLKNISGFISPVSRTLIFCPTYAAVTARFVRKIPMNGQSPTSSEGWGWALILVTGSRTTCADVNPDMENIRQMCPIEEYIFSVCSMIGSFWKMSRSCLLTKAVQATLVQCRVFARLHQTYLFSSLIYWLWVQLCLVHVLCK